MIDDLLERIIKNEELGIKDYVEILKSNELSKISLVADYLRRKDVGDIVTFILDTNINYTNVCINRCKFCAFYRDKDSKDAYVLSIDEIIEKIKIARKYKITQVLIQGGLNPDIPFEYYEEMIRKIREKFPEINVHAFSPVEIEFFSRNFRMSIREVLERFKQAGLRSIPGGGAEILVDEVRRKISPRKIGYEKWKEVVIEAHKMGIKTSATMVIGLGESLEDRVKHILRIKEIQEKTGGFISFIIWTFKPGRTVLKECNATTEDYLKTIAVSRMILHGKIKNIQASVLTQGVDVSLLSLSFGANDLGGSLIEENVITATGHKKKTLLEEDFVKIIKSIGRIPAQRDTFYNIIRTY